MATRSAVAYAMHMIWMWLAQMARDWMNRRRNHWVEISVERAWSHDLPPRLFEVADT